MQSPPESWALPQSIRSRLGSTVGRQRAMFEEGHLLLVLHAPAKPDQQERVGRFFWQQPNGEWKHASENNVTLEGHIDEYYQVLETCEESDQAATTSSDYFSVLEHLGPIHRSAGNLYGALQEARKLTKDDREIIDLRDRTYELSRATELLFTSAKNALDYTVAKQAEKLATESHQMASAAHRLNLLVALFFPIATLATIFSTSFESGLEHYPAPWPLLILVGTGLLFGIVLSFFVTATSQKK